MDLFYKLYKDAGFVPIEICTSGIIALLCLIGICLNSSLVYVTIKTKSLHSPCNILIASYAFSATLLVIGYTIKFFVFLFRINFIPIRTCYFLIVIPTIGAGFATRLQFCIGLERLAGVAFPFWYKLSGKRYIYKLLLVLCAISIAYGNYINFMAASQHWDKPVMCSYPDITYLPESAVNTNINSLVSYIGEFMSYALIWLVIWCRKSAVSQRNRKLTLSLTILISISLFGYILGLIFAQMIMPLLGLNIFTIQYVISPITNSSLVIAHGSITPILLLCSNEYLRAFRVCFGFNPQQTSTVHAENRINTIIVSSTMYPTH